MKILVFDTETTGKANMKLPHSHSIQPRMVQLAMALYETTSTKPLFCFSAIIKPDGFIIPKEAEEIHGISTKQAMDVGVNLLWTLKIFKGLLSKDVLLVGHNVQFDLKIVSIEFTKFPNELPTPPINPFYCTMQEMTSYCNLPPAWPGGGPKWPKLSEAYKHCTGKDHVEAHDALNDLRATKEIYDWLQLQPK